MGSREIRKYCDLGTEAEHLLERAIAKQGLSARAHGRILKVARTIAELAGAESIESGHIAEAIQYRTLDRMLMLVKSWWLQVDRFNCFRIKRMRMTPPVTQ